MSWLKDRFEIISRCICALRIAREELYNCTFQDYFTRDM